MNKCIFPCERCGVDIRSGQKGMKCDACLASICKTCAKTEESKKVKFKCYDTYGYPPLKTPFNATLCGKCRDREFWPRHCYNGCTKECYERKKHVKEFDETVEFVQRICWVVKDKK